MQQTLNIYICMCRYLYCLCMNCVAANLLNYPHCCLCPLASGDGKAIISFTFCLLIYFQKETLTLFNLNI